MSLFKDFAKNIGGVVKNAVFDGIARGVRSTELNNKYGSFYEGAISQDNLEFNVPDLFGKETDSILFGSNTNPKSHDIPVSFSTIKKHHGSKFTGKASINNNSGIYSTPDDTDIYRLSVPSWGYNDFINERNIYIKNLSNGFAEPNWYYFKIFFEFNTHHGLFGGILRNNTESKGYGINSAYRYLNLCKNQYSIENIQSRMFALDKFTRLLSYININAPWFFKKIKNLEQASIPRIQNFSEERNIELELNVDAIDMRLTSLMSLYKYACYDDYGNKEIIPENLRKFDMCIVLFSSPIRMLHTPINENNISYKKLYSINGDNDISNIMSYKMYKFMNCEFDVSTLGSYVPGEVNNETPFQLGGNSLKITYDKVYEYNANELMGFMVGSDGIYINDQQSIQYVLDTQAYNLISASESFIHHNIGTLLGNDTNYALGNIYSQDITLYEEKSNKSIDRTSPFEKVTDYTKWKWGQIQQSPDFLGDTLLDALYYSLGKSYKSGTAPGPYGNGKVLSGNGYHGLGSQTYKDKLDRAKNGGDLSINDKLLNLQNKINNFDYKKSFHNAIMGLIK